MVPFFPAEEGEIFESIFLHREALSSMVRGEIGIYNYYSVSSENV